MTWPGPLKSARRNPRPIVRDVDISPDFQVFNDFWQAVAEATNELRTRDGLGPEEEVNVSYRTEGQKVRISVSRLKSRPLAC